MTLPWGMVVVGRPAPSWKTRPIAIYDDDDELVVVAHRLRQLESAAHATARASSPRDRVPELQLTGIIEGRDWLDEHSLQKLSLTVASNERTGTKWFHLQVGFLVDEHKTGERYRVVVQEVKECEPPYWAE